MTSQAETDPKPQQQSPVDKGLLSWVELIRKALANQAGVEIVENLGSNVRFRFRGQSFTVTIAPDK